MYSNIRKAFRKKFGEWKIDLSEEDLFLGSKMTIPTREWKLSCIIQENEKGTYVEYYGIHNKIEHWHGRIYDDGEEESLDILREYIMYSPNIPGDRERSARDLEIHNKMLLKELEQKGLI